MSQFVQRYFNIKKFKSPQNIDVRHFIKRLYSRINNALNGALGNVFVLT